MALPPAYAGGQARSGSFNAALSPAEPAASATNEVVHGSYGSGVSIATLNAPVLVVRTIRRYVARSRRTRTVTVSVGLKCVPRRRSGDRSERRSAGRGRAGEESTTTRATVAATPRSTRTRTRQE